MPEIESLEDINSTFAITWAKQQNEITLAAFAREKKFHNLEAEAISIFEDKNQMPSVDWRLDGMLYNFWQDDTSIRGIWRRTSLDEYEKDNKDIVWELLLDIGKLSVDENENWVFAGAMVIEPMFKTALIYLSRGGKDSYVVREFNLDKKTFVANGFNLSEAKSIISMIDQDSVLLATDFGEDSLTKSGYPRTIRLWHRGEKIEESKEVFAIDKNSILVSPHTFNTPEANFSFITAYVDFMNSHLYYVNSTLELIKIPKPDDAEFFGIYKGQLLLLLRDAWREFPAGSLVSMCLSNICDINPKVMLIKMPDDKLAIQRAMTLLNCILVQTIESVSPQLYKFDLVDGIWHESKLNYPKTGCVSVGSFSAFRDEHFVYYTDFLTPPTSSVAKCGQAIQQIKREPNHFNTKNLTTKQLYATSKDGTKIPYYIIHHIDTQYDGTNPTLLYGYGGFEISLLPFYASAMGKSWLEAGNIYVMANIRGGGEFGPSWHKAALKQNRQVAFDDFIAVAEDLISRGITSAAHLGIQGESNGGLLVAAVTMQRPDLFNAVICSVPLTDMLRYNTLSYGAGASWVEEYGDPGDPIMRSAIVKYSPLHNIKVSNEVQYPEILFTSSINDDRVHPYHARAMVAKMQELGHKVFYYEHHDGGGHCSASNLKQAAFNHALKTTYLLNRLARPLVSENIT